MLPLSRLYCAIDTPDFDQALHLIRQVRPWFQGIKLGMEFYMRFGNAGILQAISIAGPESALFLDLKLHDIPNTVAGATAALMPLNPEFLTIHTAGGHDMIKAAADTVKDHKTKILGVTLLTSLSDEDISCFSSYSIKDMVRRLAAPAIKAGCHGLVCSPHEVEILRAEFGSDVILMVPGIRPEGSVADDQKRVMTPQQAIKAGADHLVIGRPVTRAEDPAKAAENIAGSLDNARAA
jgi:orotidine-5'-phosphate decarboxylase